MVKTKSVAIGHDDRIGDGVDAGDDPKPGAAFRHNRVNLANLKEPDISGPYVDVRTGSGDRDFSCQQAYGISRVKGLVLSQN